MDKEQSSPPMRRRLERFRARGFKITPQRAAILRALEEAHRHLTAEEIYELVQQDFPMMSRTTVYRNLENLVEQGLLMPLQRSGRAVQYDANLSEHHHFFCQKCGEVFDIYLEEIHYRIDSARSSLGKVRVFRPEVQLHGICQDCLRGEE